jgi:hypothetical protein
MAVLDGLVDVDRDLIRTGTADERNLAQQRAQHMCRPSKLTDAQTAEARRRRAEGATIAELGRSYDRREEHHFVARSLTRLQPQGEVRVRK